MARPHMPSTLPSAVERRELLFGRESQKADHRALAVRYQEAGRLSDALEFFAKAGDEAGVEEIRLTAVKHGDAFLLAQVERVTRTPADAATWRATAEAAERDDKLHFAMTAYQEAGDEAAAARLREAIEPAAAAVEKTQVPADD